MATREFAMNTARAFVRDCEASGLSFEKVFLFGSHATGRAHEWSDIDLLLVSDRFSANSFENLKLYSKINARYPFIETHAYPSGYFQQGDAFLEDVLKTAVAID